MFYDSGILWCSMAESAADRRKKVKLLGVQRRSGIIPRGAAKSDGDHLSGNRFQAVNSQGGALSVQNNSILPASGNNAFIWVSSDSANTGKERWEGMAACHVPAALLQCQQWTIVNFYHRHFSHKTLRDVFHPR